MDALLLVAPPERTVGHTAPPAFSMDDHGRLCRHSITGGAGYVYTGAQIIKTDMLAGLSDEVFSMWRLWEPMLAAGRLYGVIHQGGWCDVGQPESIALAEQLLLEQGNV